MPVCFIGRKTVAVDSFQIKGRMVAQLFVSVPGESINFGNKLLTMINRRKFIALSALGATAMVDQKGIAAGPGESSKVKPIVVSTWDAGIEANKGAWNILVRGGRALDAVEAGVMVTEASQNCCVGLG